MLRCRSGAGLPVVPHTCGGWVEKRSLSCNHLMWEESHSFEGRLSAGVHISIFGMFIYEHSLPEKGWQKDRGNWRIT